MRTSWRQKQLSINSRQIFLNVCDCCCFDEKKTICHFIWSVAKSTTVFCSFAVDSPSVITKHCIHTISPIQPRKKQSTRDESLCLLFFFLIRYRSSMNRYVFQSKVVIVVSLLMSHVCIVIVYSTFSILLLLFTMNGSIFTCITLPSMTITWTQRTKKKNEFYLIISDCCCCYVHVMFNRNWASFESLWNSANWRFRQFHVVVSQLFNGFFLSFCRSGVCNWTHSMTHHWIVVDVRKTDLNMSNSLFFFSCIRSQNEH